MESKFLPVDSVRSAVPSSVLHFSYSLSKKSVFLPSSFPLCSSSSSPSDEHKPLSSSGFVNSDHSKEFSNVDIFASKNGITV